MSRWPIWIGMSVGVFVADWTGDGVTVHTVKIVFFIGIALLCQWASQKLYERWGHA